MPGVYAVFLRAGLVQPSELCESGTPKGCLPSDRLAPGQADSHSSAMGQECQMPIRGPKPAMLAWGSHGL